MASANVQPEGAANPAVGQIEEDARQSRMNHLRAQVDDVRDIMTANVERVLARGERLEDLLDKSSDLEAGSSEFRSTARRVQSHMWWKNMKCNCIIAAIVLAVIAVIVIVVCYETGAFRPGGGGGGGPVTPATTTSTSTTTSTTTTLFFTSTTIKP